MTWMMVMTVTRTIKTDYVVVDNDHNQNSVNQLDGDYDDNQESDEYDDSANTDDTDNKSDSRNSKDSADMTPA